MGLTNLNWSQKAKMLAKVLTGETESLANINRNRNPDLSTWSDEELKAEHERLRQKTFRETGVMPPPLPDYSAMSDEELEARLNELQGKRTNQ